MAGVVCAVDAGTSVIKAALIDGAGRIVRSASSPTAAIALPAHPELFAFDPDAYARCLCDQLRCLAGDGAGTVQPLCLTNQRATVLALDAGGVPLAALSWADDRCRACLPEFAAQYGDERFHETTGLPLNSLLSVGKVLWLREHHPAVFAATRRFVLLHDYLLHRLGAGEYVTDYSNAACTGFFDARRRRWDPELLAAAGIGCDLLPQLAPAGSVAGTLDADLARSLGFPARIPLVTGGGDQEVACLGMGVCAPGTVGMSLGTSATVCYVTRDTQVDHHARSILVPHVVAGQWVREAFQISFASSLQWYERLAGSDVFRRSAGLSGFMPVAAPVFVPFYAGGSATTAGECAGTLAGMAATDGPDVLARSVLDGIVLELRNTFEQITRDRAVERILVGGGAARVPGLVQHLATTLGREVELCTQEEIGLLGAACLAWSATDRASDAVEVRGGVRNGATPEVVAPLPDTERESRYRHYLRWRRAVERLEAAAVGGMSRSRAIPVPDPQGQELEALREDAMVMAGIGFFRYAFDGTILSMDRGCLRILEVEEQYPDPAMVLGKNISDLFLYVNQPGSVRDTTRSAGSVLLQEYPFVTLAGRRKWSLHDSYVVFDESTGQEAIQVMARDITALKSAESRLQEANAELQRANEELAKLDQMKTDLLSNVSHELRSPLVCIRGYVEMMQQELLGPISQTQHDKLQIVLRNTDRMVGLIEGLLDSARLSQGMIEMDRGPVRLQAIVTNALEEIGPLARKRHVDLALDMPKATVFLTGDAERLCRVLVNVLENAIKFSPAGSAIAVSAVVQQESRVVLRIRDQGAGIPSAALPRIFDRFYQADASSRRQFSGLGIGLYLCRQIIEAHGGSITAESEEGRGTTIRIELPLARAGQAGPASRAVAVTESGAVPAVAGCSVLVVDDDEEVRDVMRDLLGLHKISCRVAASGSEALSCLAQFRPQVILLDVAMGEMDGLDLLCRLKADPEHAAIPVIMVTAMADREVAERALQCGAARCMHKPFSPEDLLQAIARSLRPAE